jgi:Uma2 family endonuclease
LGWLIDPESKTVEIYRANQAVEVLHAPTHLSGENILADFVLDLQEVFE